MSRFVQLHVLTSYPPSNLNRDDTGRPKTAVIGDCTRLRISSQSLKRAWRTSDIFESALKGHIGTRTKEMGIGVYQSLTKQCVGEKNAREWAKTIASQFGEASTGVQTGSLIELALILFGVTLIVNVIARTLVWRMTSLKAAKK